MPISRYQFCCGCMPIFTGVFAIAFHSFVHGIYGICLILTTYYSPPNNVVNYTTLVGYVCLTVIGFPILWVIVFQHIPAIRLASIIFTLLTVFNLVCSILYFYEYFSFNANSLLDKAFLWRYGSSWITSDQLPFTIWHLLTGLLIALTPLWFYYCYVIFIFPQYLKLLEAEEEHIPEVIILDNRFGPFSFHPPIGYPYSTNEPQQTAPEGHRIIVFQPRINRTAQQDNNPKTILD